MRSKSWAVVSLAVSLAFGASGCGESGKVIGENSGRSGEEVRGGGAVVDTVSRDLDQAVVKYGIDNERMRNIACELTDLVEKGADFYNENYKQQLQIKYSISADQAEEVASSANYKGNVFHLGVELINKSQCG
jgi:hypothetical protein